MPSFQQLRALRVLVVDDNVDLADVLCEVIESFGHTAIQVYDGQAAISACVNEHYDVVLMDIGMPKLDGWTVARQVRKLRPELVLIAHSAWGSAKDLAMSEAAGFNRHVVKPARTEELRALLDWSVAVGDFQAESAPVRLPRAGERREALGA